MSLVSFDFIVLILIGCLVFYLMPRKYQWVWLLLLSMLFYFIGGWKTIGFILFTSFTTWGGSLIIAKVDIKAKEKLDRLDAELRREQKKIYKAETKKKKQFYFWGILILNFGILAYLKYFSFMIENINLLFQLSNDGVLKGVSSLILPLGISFYTFQSMGYLIDVYWGKINPEENLLKFLLFVSFFPQIIQGPIGRHGQLAPQLYAEHKFDLDHFERGLLLMLWGYFKKLIVANRAIVIVNAVFENPTEYGGAVTLFGAFIFALQQYADFSGGIDIVTGTAELFDIHLMENFCRPYFSKSLSEFWRRWHISLGAWMRDYVFYPFAVTKAMGRFGSFVKRHAGKTMGKVAPVALGNILVFLLVGIWHGPYWHYVFWGLYNGLIIAVSAMLEPFYEKTKRKFHINAIANWYIVFCIIRTFLIVTVGGFFDRSEKISSAFYMIKNVFTNFNCSELINAKVMMSLTLPKWDYLVLLIAIIILFGAEAYKEMSKRSIRDFVLKKPLLIRWAILYVFIFFVGGLAASIDGTIGEFMYAQF